MKRACVQGLAAEVVRLRAELKVRTNCPAFPDIPAECRGRTRSAYRTAFEMAWLGRPFKPMYEIRDYARAWSAGYLAGEATVQAEILRETMRALREIAA